MHIQNMFRKDINRDITGVIKVAQNDEKSLDQELHEYIITKELRRHLGTLLDNYSRAIDRPTDKIGVWISGFFGSGKSHFLKILSYLLSNKVVGSESVVDVFKSKFDDSMMYATLTRCVNIQTESILFNIDIEGPINKDKTAVLRVFAKVFYNHLGYYGEDLKIAGFERFIDKQGKTDVFRKAFEEVNGDSWVDSRNSYAFFEDDIVAVLMNVLGMSETAARNWFNSEENQDMSIKQLVDDISEYVNSKGKDFRLLFCIDEVGQYIGDDGDLLLNLQSITEQIGSQCMGKVWVMVTSQEAVDKIVQIRGDDFSKIQARFDTRLSLSSQSVDEVIKKRILEKTEDADRLLQLVYDKEYAVLKNLFTFSDAVLDIKGYIGAEDFSATYPFVPYQFIIIQKVLLEIRQHGNAGKHISGGERSMLSGFQEATQKIQDKDENALVPFYRFYDTVHTVLESAIRRVIERCQRAADNNDGILPVDVNVLKLLYLIRYIDDLKPNINNIAILMIDDIRTDKIMLRKEIAGSLERLESQNNISRNGDNYYFLTDEEQDIAIEIRNTSVDSAAIIKSIAEIAYGEIYTSKKFKFGKYDIPFDQFVDETQHGSASGGVRLRLVTVASDYFSYAKEELIAKSRVNCEAIVILSNECPYFEELEQAAKIKKYINKGNVQQKPLSYQKIISEHRSRAQNLEKNAKAQIENAIEKAAFYVYGELIALKSGDAKEKLNAAMTQLVEGVYEKINLINVYFENDADILQILNSEPDDSIIAGTGANNEYALNEISQWLELQANNHSPVSMGDVQRRYQAIPYGWREQDIAALVARLIVNQRITIKYGGANISKDDRRLVDYLRKKSEVDKASVTRRVAPPEELMRKTVVFLRAWLGQMDIPGDEDGLVEFVKDTLESKQRKYQTLLEHEYTHEHYPEKDTVTAANNLMEDILSQKKDNFALLSRLLAKQDELRDSTEDMEDVETFFNAKSQQRAIYDCARQLVRGLQNERDYFSTDNATIEKINEISKVIGMPKPYSRIKDLTDLMQAVRNAYGVLLEQKKEEVSGVITQCMGDIHTLAGVGGRAKDEVIASDERFIAYKQKVTEAESLTALDAMIMQMFTYKDTVCKRIESLKNVPEPDATSVNIVQVRRSDAFPVKRLQSREDVDAYCDGIKEKLYNTLETSDGIQII